MPKFSHACTSSYASTLASCLLAGAASIIPLSSVATAQGNPTAGEGAFYFFGDSATGQGNWSAIVGQQGEDHTPYSANNGFQRESNGLIWAEMLGRDVDIVLDPDAESQNINFAISGAHMTRGGDLLEFGIETGVTVQTELFGSLIGNGNIEVGKNDVAFMLAGANDFLDRLEMDDPADEIMEDVAQSAAENVRALSDAGVKTIILSEMQPLQYAPQYAEEPEVQAALTDLVAQTNEAMLQAVAAEGLPADVNVITMKYGDMVSYMRGNATALGFSDVTSSCYNPETEELCSSDKSIQNGYLFFDDLHFTERAHQLEAQWWMATLAGANGAASRQTARMPRISYEQIESHRRQLNPGAHVNEDKRFAAWIVPFTYSLEVSERGRDLQANLSYDGAFLGVEGRITQDLTLGGAFSAGEMTTKFNDGGSYRYEGGAISGYAAYDFKKYSLLSLTLTKGVSDVKGILRPTGVEQLFATGDTDTQYWDVELASRSTHILGPLEIDHGMSLATGRITTDGYDEINAEGLTVSYEEQALNYHRFGIDADVRGPTFIFSDILKVTPIIDVEYALQFGDDNYGVASRLIDNTASSVMIRSSAPTEDRYETGLGMEIFVGDRWSILSRYGRQWASDIDNADESSVSIQMNF